MTTIVEFLESSARMFPDKEALVCGDVRLTYQQLYDKVSNLCFFLTANCSRQAPVSMFIDNSIEFIVAYFAILKSACIAHIIPTNASEKNIIIQLEEVEPQYILSVSKFIPKLQRLHSGERIINLSEEKIFSSTGFRETQPEDFSTIIYSSGTTSRPKGVTLRHRNVVSATKNMLEVWDISEKDTYLNVLSLAHSFGLGNVHMHIKQGGRTIIERNSINIKKFLQNIIDEKATVFAAAPATFKHIIDIAPELFASCSTLRTMITNSTYIPPSTTTEVLRLRPTTQFYTYYGLTEASRSTINHFNQNQDKLESVGKPAPNVEVKICGEEGSSLPAEAAGEVCIKGNHVIEAYWKNEEATKAIREGWIYTGDQGYLNPEGFLFLVGRKGDIINVGGEKVSPIEIEEVAMSIPEVKEVAAVGIKDRILTQVVHLFVVLEKNSSISSEEITKTLRSKLEGYKIPRKIHFKESIPKTDTGKKKRSLLRKEIEGDTNE